MSPQMFLESKFSIDYTSVISFYLTDNNQTQYFF